MKCDCEDWAESNKEIQRVFTQAHLKGVESYKGKEFVCCPWCGEGLVPDSLQCNHCFCRNDALGVLHCCKCGEFVKYEYKSYEWKTGVPDNKWRPASTSRGTNPCGNCQMNPAVNKFASGICHCALPAMNRW